MGQARCPAPAGVRAMTEACWFCDDADRTDPPPGGWLLEDDTWRAGAAAASYAVPGTVVLEARRHVADQAGFDATERATFAGVTGRLLSCDPRGDLLRPRHQWSTMDRHPHFHLWLCPGLPTQPPEVRGTSWTRCSTSSRTRRRRWPRPNCSGGPGFRLPAVTTPVSGVARRLAPATPWSSGSAPWSARGCSRRSPPRPRGRGRALIGLALAAGRHCNAIASAHWR